MSDRGGTPARGHRGVTQSDGGRGLRLDVGAVHPNRGRAGELEPRRVLEHRDHDRLNVLLRRVLANHVRHELGGRLPVAAARAYEDLDVHAGDER